MIERIEITHHRLPLDPAFGAAWDPEPRTGFPLAVVRVFDDSGAKGISAGDPMRGFVDHDHLILGSDPLDLDRLSAVLANIAFLDGRPWPLEIALWDLAGKLTGRPIWQMVGGAGNSLALYASFGTHRTPAETVDRAALVVERGFGAIKLRFGRPDLDADLAVLDAVRTAVGPDIALMVDCNQGWRMPWDTAAPWDVSHATLVARELAERDVFWMEEPLHRGDHRGMRMVRESSAVRIAGGEMTRELHEFDLMLAAGCLDVYQPDAAVTGGISGLSTLARKVRAAGHVFSPHTWGSGVALVANAHLCAGTVGAPYLEYPLDPPEWTEDRRDFLLTEAVVADGRLVLSEDPGLGVHLDEERLAATRTDRATYS